MKKEKISKEVNEVLKALNNYIDKHQGNCMVSLSICAFDNDSNVIDDRILLYGVKDVLLVDIKHMLKEIKKDERKFLEG